MGVLIAILVPTALVLLYFAQYFAAIFFLVYAVLVGSGTMYRSAFRKRYRSDPRAGEIVQFRFAPEGFAMAGSGFESRYAWSRIETVLENDAVFMFMVGRETGVPVPKRCFAPGDDAKVRAFASGASRLA